MIKKTIEKTIKKIVCVCLAAISAVCFIACTKRNDKDAQSGGYTANKRYLLGVGDVISECAAVRAVSGVDGEYMAQKCEELGMKTVRIWMHFSDLFTRVNTSDDFILNEEKCKIFHDYIAKLKAHGVERILSMNHTFLRPYGVTAANDYTIANPKTDYKMYVWQLEKYEWAYKTLVAEFPEIDYYEVGNEFDHTGGEYLHDFTYVGSWSQNGVYTMEEAAYITADLCWYAKRGIKAANENATVVLPGITRSTEKSLDYFEWLYKHIEGGYLPTGKPYSDVNVDNYFDIAAWHAYFNEGETAAQWKTRQDDFYAVMKRHGDAYKKVWFTEMGFSDYTYATKNEDGTVDYSVGQAKVAELMKEMLDLMVSDMPYLETITLFRMAEMYTYINPETGVKEGEVWTDYEEHFGLYYAPNDKEKKGAAKPIAGVVLDFSKKLNQEVGK